MVEALEHASELRVRSDVFVERDVVAVLEVLLDHGVVEDALLLHAAQAGAPLLVQLVGVPLAHLQTLAAEGLDLGRQKVGHLPVVLVQAVVAVEEDDRGPGVGGGGHRDGRRRETGCDASADAKSSSGGAGRAKNGNESANDRACDHATTAGATQ